MPRFNPIRGVPAAPPPPPPSRDDLITQIAAACMRPCAPIVPSLNTPGAFCYLDPHEGTQYGAAFPSEAVAREAWENRELDNAAAFAEQLAVMNDADLQSQASYWLKPKPVPAPSPELKRQRAARPEEKTSTTLTLKATTHTKKGHPIWIAQMTDRVERKEFTRLSAITKAGGGYWSSFGPVDIHGFIFTDKAKADAFLTLVNPDGGASVPASQSQTIPVTMPPPSDPEPVAVKATAVPEPETETFPAGFREGERVQFTPRTPGYEPTIGILREFINEGEGCHIFAPLPGDPHRVVRCWAHAGTLTGAPLASEPERDPVAEITQGRTIWNSDGTDGPVLICPPPAEVVTEVEAPVLTPVPLWRQRLARR